MKSHAEYIQKIHDDAQAKADKNIARLKAEERRQNKRFVRGLAVTVAAALCGVWWL